MTRRGLLRRFGEAVMWTGLAMALEPALTACGRPDPEPWADGTYWADGQGWID